MDNKKVLSVVVFIAITLFFIIFSANYYISYADNEKVFYVEDLKNGDFIPKGSILKMSTYFFDNSGGQPTSKNDVYFRDENGNIIANIVENNTIEFDVSLIMPSYNDYDGWIFVEYHKEYPTNNWIEFEVANEKQVEVPKIQEPTMDNNYKISVDDEAYSNNWFFKKQKILDPIKGDSIFENDMYMCDKDGTVEGEFNVENNSILKFMMKGFMGYNSKIFINDIETPIFLYHIQLFSPISIIIKDDGKIFMQKPDGTEVDTNVVYDGNGVLKLKFTKCSRLYLKNFEVLTKINDGNTLDTTKVKSGDIIHWELYGDNVKSITGEFTYFENKQEDDSTDTETPTEPESPENSNKPTEPENSNKPTEPESPENSNKPTEPESPENLNKPENPNKPTEPEKLEQSKENEVQTDGFVQDDSVQNEVDSEKSEITNQAENTETKKEENKTNNPGTGDTIFINLLMVAIFCVIYKFVYKK